MRLPATFEEGDLELDVQALAERMRELGPQLEPEATILEADPGTVRFLAVDTSMADALAPTAVIVMGEHVPAGLSLDGYGDVVARSLTTKLPDARIDARDPARVGGYEALRLVITIQQSGGSDHLVSYTHDRSGRLLVYLLKLGSLILVAELATPENEFSVRAPLFDEAVRTIGNYFVPKDPVPDDAAGCGSDVDLSVVGAPPVGASYEAGQTVALMVRVRAPGCTLITGSIGGFHRDGSGWYDYWCIDHPGKLTCAGGRLPSRIAFEKAPLDAGQQVVRLHALTGTAPPENLGSPAPAEGFVACHFVLHLSDDKFGGRAVEYALGEYC